MGLKVTVDLNACHGYACCVMTAPEVFDLDDETGKAIVLNPEPDRSLWELVDKAASGCPAHAITVETT